MQRDFTYVEDLVEAITRLIPAAPEIGKPVVAPNAVDTLSAIAPWRIVNIGGGEPVGLIPFIETIERRLGKSAIRNMLPMQPGDVPATFADHHLLEALTGYRPKTSVQDGVSAFVDWYTAYRKDVDAH
jgi:UDP-glucuronate 4-epimerase